MNLESILLQSWGDESSQGGLMNGSLWEDETPMDKLTTIVNYLDPIPKDTNYLR